MLHPTAIICLAAALLAFPAKGGEGADTLRGHFASLERHHGGRLGLAALDPATGRRVDYRASERFALCSTFKVVLVAAVLARVDAQQEALDHRIPYGAADLLDYAPVARQHLPDGQMTVEALCAAAIQSSDNTAANLLLNLLGGPKALTAYLSSLGDPVTRLDRNEPALNENLPGDPRDTTSPAAMLDTMQKILAGQVLSPASRRRIEGLLLGCTTGSKRLRAGLPAGWRVGDKTGTGSHGATNDIAVLWPPERPPLFVVVYYSGSAAPLAEREAVLAEAGRLIAAAFARQDL